ncbi:MAG: hypothetical protein ACXAD7_07830 [Candidatus Kariarchaeaceae archaeon]|jgi:hypothetical protein
MSPNLLLNIKIVSKTGLTLAEFPAEEDVTKSQLAGGIMSALISFSKEVHNRDLESLSFGDKTIYFMPIHDFIIIAELDSEIDSIIVSEITKELRNNARILLEGHTVDTLSLQDASYITNELANIVHSIEIMIEYGKLSKRYIIANPTFVSMELVKSGDTFVIQNPIGNEQSVRSISQMIITGLATVDTISLRCGVLKIPNLNMAAFVIARYNPEKIDVGGIIVAMEEIETLIALNQILQDLTKQHIKANGFQMKQLLDYLVENAQVEKIALEDTKTEFISFSTLQKNVKNLEKALYCVANQEKVVVIGEPVEAKIIINSLALFTAHQPSKIVEWMENEDEIDFHIAGMSKVKCDSLLEKNILGEQTTMIDLISGKLKSPLKRKSKFIKNLFEKARKVEVSEGAKIISDELMQINYIALEATTCATLTDKREILNRLQMLKNDTRDDSKFEMIQNFAMRFNPWLKDVILDPSIDSVWI